MNYDAMSRYEEIRNSIVDNDDEILADYNCPVCGYPIVIENGLELCYRCGWSKGNEGVNDMEGYYGE